MQKELEALLVALHREQQREADLLRGILTAIAVGGAARKQMIEDIATAVAAHAHPHGQVQASRPAFIHDQISDALMAFRQ